jgi:hypothetical protein
MKKFLVVLPLMLSLGACASFDQKVQTVWSVITSAAVTPQQIIVAANAFDAVEASATQYLSYCSANAVNAASTACALKTRQTIVAAVRAGRAARTQLEPYVTSGTAGPSAIYNTLAASITTLQTNLPVTAK